MKTVVLRQKVKKGIHDGTILCKDKEETRSLSRFIAYLSKSDCELIISKKRFSVYDFPKALAKSNGVQWSQPSENNSGGDGASDGDYNSSEGDTEGKNTEDGANNQGNSDDDTDCYSEEYSDNNSDSSSEDSDGNSDSNSNCANNDYQLFTTEGAKTLEDVKSDMNIEHFGELEDKVNASLLSVKNAKDNIEEEAVELINKCMTTIEEAKKHIGDTQKVEVVLDGKVVTSDDEIFHPKFAEILTYCKLDRNVMLVGGAGTGKTTLARQVADAMELDFGGVSCTMGMSESHLLGTINIKGQYTSRKFIDIYENGGVWLFDEFDALDSNMFCVVNSALANGYLAVPNRTDKPIAKRHKDCIVIACGNTWGNGQGSRQYSGRNLIDGATLDRFTPVEVGYDNKLESFLVGEHKNAFNFLNELKERCANKNLDKIISTRLYKKANVHLTNKVAFDNKSPLRTFAEMITASWSDREKSKIEFDDLVAKHDKKKKAKVVDGKKKQQ